MRSAIRFVLLLCSTTMLYAQTPVEQTRFALEISEDGLPPHLMIVREGEFSVSTFPGLYLHALPGRDSGDAERPQPSALKLDCELDGDAVVITASVTFGALNETDPSLSLQGNLQQGIGKYELHLNESIVLRDMEQFGLQPWTIKIVNAQLPPPASLPGLNKVPSIQPEIVGKDREGYRIALHNLSSRAVTAFVVETTFSHNNSYSEEGNDHDPLIAPGASHEFHLFCDALAFATSSGIAPDPAPCALVLEAALFADGSYEGDASAAAALAARPIADEFQSRRVHELLGHILADSALEDAAKLALIHSELPKLSEQADPAILEQIRLRFPGLPSTAWSSVSASIQSALAVEKQKALRGLKDFENLPEQGSSSRSLAEWWSAWEGNQ